jgi:hypothetical protein
VPAGWWAVDEPYASVALLRIASLLLTLPIIPISFWTANELLGSVERAALATAALALVPQYLLIHAGIKNDGLADLSASVVLGLLIFLAKRPARARQLRWLVLLSLALSLDLLSKLTNVLPLILIVAWSLWQLAKKQWRASHIAALYGPLALVVGGYLAATAHGRSVMSYWLGASQSHPHFGGSALELLNLLSTSTWARFGWMNVEVAPPITTLLSVIILVGIALSAADLVCHAERQDQRPAAAIGLLSFVVALPLVIAFGVLQNQPQGRFLFPVLGLLIVTAERGYFAYAPAWGRLVSKGLPLFLLGLNVASLVRLAAVYGS